MDERIKWNNVADNYQQIFKLGMNDYNKQLLSFLIEKEMLFPECKVIDVGCGAGKYGTYFAELGSEVTLIDISDRMIELASKNMEPYTGMWRAFCCDFNKLNGDEAFLQSRYDLAVSTMSPAIHNLDTVKQFSEITCGWCFVARFREWKQPFRDKLLKKAKLTVTDPFMKNLDEDCENIKKNVQSAGYTPQSRLVEYKWEDRRTPREMTEYLISRFFLTTRRKKKLKVPF